MRHRRSLALWTVGLLAGCAGCTDTQPASDVRGNYDLSYDDRLTVTLTIGGAKQTTEAGATDVVTFQVNGQPVTFDLGAFCGREDIDCPSETLWNKVAVDQPNIAAQNPNSHVINVIDNEVHDLPAGQSAEVVSGLINQADEMTLVLGAGSKGNGDNCGLLALSIAEARFSHAGEFVQDTDAGIPDAGQVAVAPEPPAVDGGFVDVEDAGPPVVTSRITHPPGAPVDGMKDGRVRLGFLGVCAVGPALLGATVELATGYTAVRTGDFDPPPFTPLDPVDVEPGIVDAGPGT